MKRGLSCGDVLVLEVVTKHNYRWKEIGWVAGQLCLPTGRPRNKLIVVFKTHSNFIRSLFLLRFFATSVLPSQSIPQPIQRNHQNGLFLPDSFSPLPNSLGNKTSLLFPLQRSALLPLFISIEKEKHHIAFLFSFYCKSRQSFPSQFVVYSYWSLCCLAPLFFL